MLLQNQVALITGGSQGIGFAIAKAFAEQGASLVIADLRADEAVLRSALPEGASVSIRLIDVTDEAAVKDLFASLPRLDVVVNSVGTYGPVKMIEAMDRESWDRTFTLNLTTAMFCCREAVKKMRTQKSGNIVNIASNVARRGLPYRGCYVATKWAMMGLTQTLALETAADGIRVNSILPGPVDTPHLREVMHLHAEVEEKSVEDVAEAWRTCAPMQRFIEPSEIGSVAVFLASSMSSAMTGQGLNVTGGFIMT